MYNMANSVEGQKKMSTTDNVAVILCTYNGAKYIDEQISSILDQTYPNVHIYIQDDRSTDDTWEVLQKYTDNSRVTLFQSEKNLGYPFAFYDLLSKVNDADYYSFSDQDDVWQKDKIERAMNLLSGSDKSKPAIVFANYDVCDENLNKIRTSSGPNRKPDFLYSLYACLGLGFTCVLNHKAKDLIQNRRSKRNITKDVWMGMCCTAFGEAFFDPKPCALHRRNPGAFSSQDKNFFQIQKDRIRKFVKNDGLKNIYDVMKEFYEIFGPELPEARRKELELFLYRGWNPVRRLKKVFFGKRLRYDRKDEFMLRMIFLIGKL